MQLVSIKWYEQFVSFHKEESSFNWIFNIFYNTCKQILEYFIGLLIFRNWRYIWEFRCVNKKNLFLIVQMQETEELQAFIWSG